MGVQVVIPWRVKFFTVRGTSGETGGTAMIRLLRICGYDCDPCDPRDLRLGKESVRSWVRVPLGYLFRYLDIENDDECELECATGWRGAAE